MKDFINPYNDKIVNIIKKKLIEEVTVNRIKEVYKFYTNSSLYFCPDYKECINEICGHIWYEYSGKITYILVINDYDKFYTLDQCYKMLKQALIEIIEENKQDWES